MRNRSSKRTAKLPGFPLSRRGTSAVELACILPLVLTLLFSCIDFGRVLHYQSAVINAARVGAEYGATHRFTDDSQELWEQRIVAVATEEAMCLESFEADRFDVQVAVFGTPDVDADVEVTSSYEFVTVIDWPGLPHVIPLGHQVRMRQHQ